MSSAKSIAVFPPHYRQYKHVFSVPETPFQNGTFHSIFNLLNPAGHVIHQQFNIQQLYALPTLYLCGLYLSENKQRLVPLTA